MDRTVAALDREWAEIIEVTGERCGCRPLAPERAGLCRPSRPSRRLEARRASDDAAQPVLGALGRLATVDALAARTLLQALVPGLLAMASTSCSDDPEAMDLLVSLAWERIRTYPLTRTGSVAANVLLEARKRSRASRQIEEPDAPLYQAPMGKTSPSAEDVALTTMAVVGLVRPHRDAVGHLALSIIVESRVNDVPFQVLAAQHSTSTQQDNCIRCCEGSGGCGRPSMWRAEMPTATAERCKAGSNQSGAATPLGGRLVRREEANPLRVPVRLTKQQSSTSLGVRSDFFKQPDGSPNDVTLRQVELRREFANGIGSSAGE